MSTTATTKTLDCLQKGFEGESNARAKYLAFATRADEEGYAYAASLFRAAGEAEKIHAANHAAEIKKLGVEPKAVIHPAEVKSTRDNLAAAVAGETYEYQDMYPQFLEVARGERHGGAIRSFNWALRAETEHARLYSAALASLDAGQAAVTWYVCADCGWTTATKPATKCPVCAAKPEKFVAVS
jgi:rubrerythrin